MTFKLPNMTTIRGGGIRRKSTEIVERSSTINDLDAPRGARRHSEMIDAELLKQSTANSESESSSSSSSSSSDETLTSMIMVDTVVDDKDRTAATPSPSVPAGEQQKEQAEQEGGDHQEEEKLREETYQEDHVDNNDSESSAVVATVPASDRIETKPTSSGTTDAALHTTTTNNNKNRSVHFNNLTIYEFPIIVGDNPGVSTGVPITIDWTPVNRDDPIVCPIDDYEQQRPGPTRSQAELRMPSSYRTDVLRSLGFSRSDMQRGTKTATVIRQRRRRTAETLHLSKAYEIVERLKRSTMNATVRRSVKSQERKMMSNFVTTTTTAAVSNKENHNNNHNINDTNNDDMDVDDQTVDSSRTSSGSKVGMKKNNNKARKGRISTTPRTQQRTSTSPFRRWSSTPLTDASSSEYVTTAAAH